MKFTRGFLGTWLVNEGIITQKQLEDALEYQRQNPEQTGVLGKALVHLGYCSEDDIARIIAKQAGVPFVSLEKYNIDPAAITTVSVDAMKRYRAFPIGFNNGKLLVAMQKPTDIVAIDNIRSLTGLEVMPVFSPDSELDVAIEKYSREALGFNKVEEETPQVEELTENIDDDQKPAVQLANLILSQAVAAKASDVHIERYEKRMRVRFRIDGVLHDIMEPPVKMHATLVSRLKVMANLDIADRRVPQDGRMSLRIEGRPIDIRMATLPTGYGERLTMRLLDGSARVISLEELGVATKILEKYRDLLKLPYGFILVTGPTGSGKSTTLYASLNSLDRVSKNVITIEDPVEYRMEGVNQIQINPQAGLTFASGLRSILRNDPDIIMVGEIRDHETAKIAIESAMTGHMVLATLHTNDAPGAITRLTEMGVEPFLIASSLVCVLAQRLARVLCPHCKEKIQLPREDLAKIPDFPFEAGEDRVTLYKPKGCMRCSNTGFRGRVGIYELLFVTEKIQRLALAKASAKEITKAALAEGMVVLRQDGLLKVKQGITSLEEVLRVVV
ncbi:GspE/PulE family protein [Desulfotomaculum sp. 1211_IL3151]|uniref:GspE/PulE family protein n=1 Tax=Desulfotomaculum sp. 1211_IL3151 TaxID=3084055 RepID=UPI002FDA3329